MSRRLLLILVIVFSVMSFVTAQRNDEAIIFISDADGNPEIYQIGPDGENRTRLTNHPGQDFQPQWSPDRNSIVFVSTREDDRPNIYTMNADGSNVRRLTEGSSYNEYPSWSPDGRYISYVSDETGNYEIFTMDANGANPRRLTQTEEYELTPVWSPDGRQIVFLREDAVSFASKIFIMDNAGGGQRRLVEDIENDGDMFSSPAWSPDGTQIAFSVQMFFSNGSTLTDLVVYDMQTGETRSVVSYVDSYIETLSWDSTGENIVYELGQSGSNTTLALIAIDGSSTSVLTSADANAESPSWYTPITTQTISIGEGSEVRAPNSDIQCPGTLATRLVVDEVARVTVGGTNNRLRSGAGTSNGQIGTIPPGGIFIVLDGPVCNNGYAWWQVDYNGTIGWTAEASNTDYWLERLAWGAPPGLSILTGGIGQSNGRAQGPGEMQVEYYCPQIGYFGIQNDNTNWYCINSNGVRVYTLQQADFDQICEDTYRNSNAIARRNGSGSISAYRWRCYEPQS